MLAGKATSFIVLGLSRRTVLWSFAFKVTTATDLSQNRNRNINLQFAVRLVCPIVTNVYIDSIGMWPQAPIPTSRFNVYRHLPKTNGLTDQVVLSVWAFIANLSGSDNIADKLLKLMINTNNMNNHIVFSE